MSRVCLGGLAWASAEQSTSEKVVRTNRTAGYSLASLPILLLELVSSEESTLLWQRNSPLYMHAGQCEYNRVRLTRYKKERVETTCIRVYTGK